MRKERRRIIASERSKWALNRFCAVAIPVAHCRRVSCSADLALSLSAEASPTPPQVGVDWGPGAGAGLGLRDAPHLDHLASGVGDVPRLPEPLELLLLLSNATCLPCLVESSFVS